jgi:hypothetical protein
MEPKLCTDSGLASPETRLGFSLDRAQPLQPSMLVNPVASR